MAPADYLLLLAAGVLLAAAAASDLHTRLIPNWLTLPALGLGALTIGIRCLYDYPAWIALLTSMAALTFTYLLWLAGCWGGGDAKACLAVLLLASPAFPVLCFAVFFSGCLALLLVVRQIVPAKGAIAGRPLGPWLLTAYLLSAGTCVAWFGGAS